MRRRADCLSATALARGVTWGAWPAALVAVPLALAPTGAGAATYTVDAGCQLAPGTVCKATSHNFLPANSPIPSPGLSTDTISFTGGALTLNGAGLSYDEAVTLSTATDTLDQDGHNTTFAGTISGSGGITIANAGSGGSVSFTKTETYTGTTTINSGATLTLTGTIANSAKLVDNGTFNVNGGNTSITSLSGSGSVVLKNGTILTLSNASALDTFSGGISGGNKNSGLTIAGGAATLTGVNTYNGTTTINTGATLILSGSGAITTPVSDSGTFDIRGTNSAGATTVNSGATPTAVLTGNGKLTSDVSNNGVVRPFDTVSNKAAAFTIIGNYTQGSTGILDIAVGGLTAGNYGQLHVTGTKNTVTLAGTLDVDTYNSFIFPVGQNTLTDIVDYPTGSSGDFTDLAFNGSSCTSLGGNSWLCGRHLTFSLLTGTTMNLRVTRTPEPATFALLASGLVGLLGLRRLTRKKPTPATTHV